MLQFVPLVVLLVLMAYAFLHGKLRHDQRARIVFSVVGGLVVGALVIAMVDKEWSGFGLLGPFAIGSLGIWIAGGLGMKSYRKSYRKNL